MTTCEANKALAIRFCTELINQGRFEVADEILAPEFVYHRTDGPLRGADGIKSLFKMVHQGMPDVHGELEHILAEGEKVAIRVRASGTHSGDMFGIPPTGKKASWIEMHILRIVDGKITDIWGMMDMMGLFQQLGIL